MSNLKGCPHCGNEEVEMLESHVVFSVECGKCEVHLGGDLTEKAAVEKWNSRASGWISVKDKLPNHGQDVAFVAISPLRPESAVNGRVLGGRYDAQLDAFSIPGCCYEATYWMPLPGSPNA